MDATDLELLRIYLQTAASEPFAQLVERHSSWIFAASRRRLGDEHLADDATQAVFIVLAEKAAQLVAADRAEIGAWLFHVMHLTCCRLRRTRSRRRQRESEIVREPTAVEQNEADLRLLLEDAIAQLSPADREAVVLRFYGGADFTTVGQALHLSPDAARKRVSRALMSVRESMLQDGIDAIPDEFLAILPTSNAKRTSIAGAITDVQRVNQIAKGTMIMVQQMQAIDFTIWSAEFCVKDVEANLDFFEKLGFVRHFIDTPDAMGRVSRASLRGGKNARIWLRRADESDGTRPTPGVTHFFWIDGGTPALTAHRDAIAAQGVQVSAFNDDITLRNFTVNSPDGYVFGFFTAYK